MRILRLVFLLFLLLVSPACTRWGRLYNLTTGEVTTMEYSYSGSGRGKIRGVLPSGEKLQGEYVTIAGGRTDWGMIYASVYGAGGSTSGSGTVLSSQMESKQRGTAIATGDKGTIIQCEYITSAWSGAGSGACKDNKGVLYKLMF